jgi:hypothetical protein
VHRSLCRIVVGFGLGPLAALQPIALAVPSSWAANNFDEFAGSFTIESPLCICLAVVTLLGSYSAAAALRLTREVREELEEHALQTIGLLEAAMPPVVARELLEDKPPEALAHCFPNVSIAFVSLEDYAARASGDPSELLSWLNAVYIAFDALVDAYEERVNKIEIVREAPRRGDVVINWLLRGGGMCLSRASGDPSEFLSWLGPKFPSIHS